MIKAEDILIIEGYPTYEPQHAGITVHPLSLTTKQQQAPTLADMPLSALNPAC